MRHSLPTLTDYALCHRDGRREEAGPTLRGSVVRFLEA